MGKKIGIDLGTTYSCVAYLNDNGGLEVVKNQEGNNTTPSVVFFDPDGQTVVVGEQARPGAAFAPDNLVERVKSKMGDKEYTVPIMGNNYSPTAISSIILKKLKADTEEHLGDTIEGCVITCPAYFGTIAKAATLKAAEEAGLNVYSIINEPTAAAFAYAYIKNEDVNKTVLIYDLGGGTFDCTLLKMEFVGDQKKLNVVASNGDPSLGGKDWDNALIDHVIEEFCRETGEDEDAMRADSECMVDLSESVEKIKKQLTARETVKLPVNYNGNKQVIEITRDTFDSITESLLQKTISLVNAMLNKENYTPDVFDEIVLVGGSTYMPQVEACLKATYGKPMSKFEPNEAVAKGAALMAAFSYDCAEDSQGSNDYNSQTNSNDEGGTGFTVKTRDGNGSIVVGDIINKSYGIKIWDEEQSKHLILNILMAGTEKPCKASSADSMGLVVGNAKKITVCETDEKDVTIEYDEAFDVYSGPLNIPAGLNPKTPVEVILDLNQSGILAIKVIAGDTVTDLVFDPSTGGASTAGIDAVKNLSLG